MAALPCPPGADLFRWLQVFPSYGFLMTLDERDWPQVQTAFAFEGVRCERVGQVNASGALNVQLGEQRGEFWNLREQAFTGFSYPHLDLSPLNRKQQEH
ncbi:hypothetical protein D3C86_1949770 [compost metagenome]